MKTFNEFQQGQAQPQQVAQTQQRQGQAQPQQVVPQQPQPAQAQPQQPTPQQVQAKQQFAQVQNQMKALVQQIGDPALAKQFEDFMKATQGQQNSNLNSQFGNQTGGWGANGMRK